LKYFNIAGYQQKADAHQGLNERIWR